MLIQGMTALPESLRTYDSERTNFENDGEKWASNYRRC